MKLDVFNHFFPSAFFKKMGEVLPRALDMHSRVRSLPSIYDLDARFRIMDRYDDYAQIPTLSGPPLEAYGPPAVAAELARIGNDGLAELVARHPDRFPAFVATVAMNDIEAAVAEAKRAIDELGAVGVQIFSNINGRPVYSKETLPLFDLMADYDLPIWMHPARGAAFADYAGEPKSHYEIWWTFGWPYETSAAMAHMVFGGLFDRHPDIKIVTHHMGGLVPYLEGRVGPGMDQLGTRTSDEDYTGIIRDMHAKGRRPVDCFRMFYADTALFGASDATRCGLKFFGTDHVLFASDMPFDPEQGAMFIRWTIEILDRLDLSPAERYAIYEGNVRRMCRLGVAAPSFRSASAA